jgi:HEAT repeat protein
VRSADPPRTFHGKTFAEWTEQLGKGTPQERGRAAMALGLGPFGKQAVPVLIKALDDREAQVRHRVITALGELGLVAKEAIPNLAALLDNESDHAALCLALARMGTDAGPVLFETLKGKQVRGGYVSRVCADMGAAAVPLLEKALKGDADDRRLAVWWLLDISPLSAPAVPALLAALEREQDRSCRHDILCCFRWIGPKAQAAIPALVKLLDDEIESGHATEVLLAIGKPSLPPLYQALEKGSAVARLEVLKRLRPELEGALPLVLARLTDRHPETRQAAATTLAYFAVDLQEHLPLLYKCLDDANPQVRGGVLRAIASIRPQSEETSRLVALGLLDPSIDVRSWAETCLCGTVELSGAATAVLVRASKDRREEVRERAARCFGWADPNDPKVIESLLSATVDPEPAVRLAAVQTIGYLGEATRRFRRASTITAVEAIVPALRARLGDPDEMVRLCAASAMCQVGYPTDAAIRQIAAILAEPPDSLGEADLPVIVSSYRETKLPPLSSRAAARSCLAGNGQRAAVALPSLLKGLKHAEPWVRTLAATTLGEMGSAARPAIPALAALIEDADGICQRAVIAALAKIGHEGIPILVRALEGKNTRLKSAICRGVTHLLGDPQLLISAVERLLFDPDEGLCDSAFYFLTEMENRGRPLKKALLRRLENESEHVRGSACYQLAQFGSEAATALPTVKLLLLDPSPWVRSQAVSALAAFDPRGKEVLPSLLESLTDRNADVRIAALTALGQLGPSAKAALSRVQAAQKDSSHKARLEAALSLWRISGQKEEALQTLRVVYREAKGTTRVEAVGYMRLIEKHREQLDMLVHLLQDDDQDTRLHALHNLASLEGEAANIMPALRALTKHRVHAVREAALDLLDSLAEKSKR